MAQSLSHPEERTSHAPDNPDPTQHVPGTMDVSEQERTFERFMRLVTRAAIVIVVLLIFLALVNG
jgi:hypothetical protein